MPDEVLLVTLIIVLGLAGLAWFINNKLKEITQTNQDDQKLKDLVNQVFGEVSEKVSIQAKQILEQDKEAIYKDNQHQKEVIEKLVKQLKDDIDKRQEEIRKLEKDRSLKFGELSKTVSHHQEITKELQASTQALSKVLSNNQARGDWGETIIENLLTKAGLVESTHYEKQSILGTVRPDIILLLPEQRKVVVDVKFPYSQIQQMATAENKQLRLQHQKQFERDVKQKIVDISDKYIQPDNGTLDYAIMFVPNEMVFSFINQKFPHLVSDAMSRRVMIVSPFTFLIVARTVFESYRSFTMATNLKQITSQIKEFAKEWGRFSDEFGKLERTIDRLRKDYDQINSTRYKQMNRRIEAINDLQQDHGLTAGDSPKQIKSST